MKYVFLDGERIFRADDLHRAFETALDLPEWYGNNLDALHDCLTEPGREVCVVAVHTEELKDHLGRKWSAFLRLMRDLSDQGAAVRFLAEPFEE